MAFQMMHFSSLELQVHDLMTHSEDVAMVEEHYLLYCTLVLLSE